MLGLQDIIDSVSSKPSDLSINAVSANTPMWNTQERVPFCTLCNQYDHWDSNCPNGSLADSQKKKRHE